MSASAKPTGCSSTTEPEEVSALRASPPRAVFTPGPWVASETRYHSDGCDRRNVSANGAGDVVAVVFARSWAAQDEANARLIASAPELYEAARALIADVRRRYPGEELRCEYMRALDAALAKARGEQ